MLLTALVAVPSFFVEVTAMGAMLSDPGRGGDTPRFEHGKSLGGTVFLLFPLVVAAVLALIHLPRVQGIFRLRKALR